MKWKIKKGSNGVCHQKVLQVVCIQDELLAGHTTDANKVEEIGLDD